MTSTRESVAGEVLAELARRRMTRRALAAKAGINATTLERRLTGQYPFTYDELVAIAAVFDLPVTTILARAEENGGAMNARNQKLTDAKAAAQSRATQKIERREQRQDERTGKTGQPVRAAGRDINKGRRENA